MNTDLESIVKRELINSQIESLIEGAVRRTIYTTSGYDESLTGTVDQIIEYLESELGDRVEKSVGMTGPILKVFESTANTHNYDDVYDLKFEIQLIETIILGELK